MTRAVHLSCTDATLHTFFDLQHSTGRKHQWSKGGGGIEGGGGADIAKLDAGRQCARWCHDEFWSGTSRLFKLGHQANAMYMLHLTSWLSTFDSCR